MFRVNPAFSADQLAADFARYKRLHLPDFLDGDGAERLLAHLEQSPDWKLVLNGDERLYEIDRAGQGALTGDQRQTLDRMVYDRAASGFQYRYETLRVPDAERDRLARNSLLDAFASFLSSEPVLDFFRSLLDAPELTFADAQATAYGPGHFLTAHDDAVEGKNRHAAFVFNLSRDWRADWGGLLLFHEPGRAAAEALIPAFNALNIFAVPQRHSVSLVAPFAPRPRYSITGWLRSGPKP